MKTKKHLFTLIWLFMISSLFSQQEFCPGNYFDNGDLEIGTPTASDQDINLAQGFSSIWGPGSIADFYAFNAGPFTPKPAPATGNYAGFWVSNHPFTNTTWREGLYNTFLTPIVANTGNYTFSFDVACLFKDAGVNADVELGVYGIYNPSAGLGATPTSQFAPDNLNLFPGNTVLLGNILLDGDCSNIKQNVSVNIVTAGLIIPSITHIMISHSDTVISYADGGGKRYVGVDNFCLTESESNDQGSFCCEVTEENPNLVTNGNFEAGDFGFISAYSQTATTYPGEYDVTTTAAAFGANVTDHSFCDDPSAYLNNDMFMVVNGKTQQSGSSIIWEQNISGLEIGKEYKMCANFKDMEQCTFNILPEITMSAGSNFVTQVINTNDADPCDWERLEICFIARRQSMSFKIELDETGNGDGNDIAIDDIAIQKKQDPNYFLTVQHQGNNNAITASLNTIVNTDDNLLNSECEDNQLEDYYWFVYETTVPTNSQLPLTGANMVPGTFGWASNTIGGGSGNPTNTTWLLTTTFPNYTTFDSNKFYVIGMWVPSCCESCYTEKWMYQITYNSRTNQVQYFEDGITNAFKEQLKEMFVPYAGNNIINHRSKTTISTQATVFPNPANKNITVSLANKSIRKIQIVSISGKAVYSETISENNSQKNINVSNLTNGVYIVNIIDENQKRYSSKFIKK